MFDINLYDCYCPGCASIVPWNTGSCPNCEYECEFFYPTKNDWETRIPSLLEFLEVQDGEHMRGMQDVSVDFIRLLVKEIESLQLNILNSKVNNPPQQRAPVPTAIPSLQP